MIYSHICNNLSFHSNIPVFNLIEALLFCIVLSSLLLCTSYNLIPCNCTAAALQDVLPAAVQSWIAPLSKGCSQEVLLRVMKYTLWNNYFEHFLEFLADQTFSFGVSKPDSLSIFVNQCVIVAVGVKASLSLVALADPYILSWYSFVQCWNLTVYYLLFTRRTQVG